MMSFGKWVAPRAGVLGLMLAAVLANVGCSPSEDQPQRTATEPGQLTPVGPPKARDPGKIREELRMRVELPDYYPDDAPIYPGASTSSAGRHKGRVTTVFTTEDSPDRVSEYIQAKLATVEWAGIAVDPMGNGSVIRAGKDDREISILISGMDEGTEYELTMMIVAVDP